MSLLNRPFLTAALVLAASPALAAQEIPDHSTFTAVLSEVVQDELVDYAALREFPEGLELYLARLAATPPGLLEAAPLRVQLAFWINAYNACALKLVVDNYPIGKASFPTSLVKSLQGVPGNSIRQIPDTWSRKFCAVAGADRALDEIEHEIIRPMGEPRIHFAVNCASRSCPVLAPAAYTGDALDEQLDAAVQRLLTNPAHYRLEQEERARITLNKVLDWYKDDFGGTEGVVEFLLPYLTEEDREYVTAHAPPRVDYFDYDWTLNDTAVFGVTGGQ
jgi:hypothetical protein